MGICDNLMLRIGLAREYHADCSVNSCCLSHNNYLGLQ